MKKQELIHLHGLLAEVSNYCRETNDAPVDLENYHTLGIRPTSIHKSKTEHKDAVFALTHGITSSIEIEERETMAAKAD